MSVKVFGSMLVVVTLSAAAPAAAQTYRVVQLAPDGVATDITDSGFITGCATYADGFAHFIGGRDGVESINDSLVAAGLERPRPGFCARGANNQGQVVGAAFGGVDSELHGYVYERGVVTAISRSFLTEGFDISNVGEVVGAASIGERSRPVVYRDMEVIELELPADARAGYAYKISDGGSILGIAEFPNPNDSASAIQRATMYARGGKVDTVFAAGDHIAAINARGDMIGSGPEGGFLITHDGKRIGLPGLPAGINDVGDIVGTFGPPASGTSSFLWRAGVVTDLNSALVDSEAWSVYPRAINNAGEIVGEGYLEGQQYAVMLEAVEPAK
jgi:uncharacterized membrane protein